ncbi:hypothetical protein V6N11_077260 [Hibiscus sabdariffa]|uniref:Uncharacterized protein n=1 Tax=Hibiscus sabdariffa TaxID=183260 RepID=A0ABR2TDA9_9ROSI
MHCSKLKQTPRFKSDTNIRLPLFKSYYTGITTKALPISRDTNATNNGDQTVALLNLHAGVFFDCNRVARRSLCKA